jgi:hypothetical protein
LELIDGRKGSVDKDHWAFWIGEHVVPVKIPNSLNDAINGGKFDILDKWIFLHRQQMSDAHCLLHMPK